jgi:hypothetical protein
VVSEHVLGQLWATLMSEEGLQNITYRRRRYRSVEGREEEMEGTPGKNANLSEDREDGLFRGLMKALQDIAEGQRETREFMGRITSYALGSKHGEERGESSKRGQMEEGGNTHKPHIEVITSRTNPQNRPQDYSEIPRSTMPKFLGPQETGTGGQVEQDEPLAAYFQEYKAMDPDLREAMTFAEFCSFKGRNRPRFFNRGPTQSYELQRTVGKLTLPYFDGTSKCTARAWVQKLDTYFQLNPMAETDAIKLATLHLEGEAQDWWYHGMTTLGHAHIVTYAEFTGRLVHRFDRRDPEMSFRDLAQLKQTGSADAYISDFQRISVMVTDIFEARLVMLFTEGLTEPLRGWVKAYKPTSLQDAVSRARDLQESVPKPKFTPRPNFPTKFDDRTPPQRDGTGQQQRDWAGQPQRDWTGRNRMDDATRQDLRRRKLCFSCQEPWVPGHRCAGKAKAHYIEVFSDSGEDDGSMRGYSITLLHTQISHLQDEGRSAGTSSDSFGRWRGIPQLYRLFVSGTKEHFF